MVSLILTYHQPGARLRFISPSRQYLGTDIQASTKDARDKEPHIKQPEVADHPCFVCVSKRKDDMDRCMARMGHH